VVLEHRQARPGSRDLGKFKDTIQGQKHIASCWREDSKPDLAIEIYRKLAVQDEKNRPTWLGEIAWTYRHRAGKVDLAVATYRDPDQHGRHEHGELSMADRGHIPAVWPLAGRDHRLSPARTLPRKLQAHGECNRNLKKYEEAITLYRQIMGGAARTWDRGGFLVFLQIAIARRHALVAFGEVVRAAIDGDRVLPSGHTAGMCPRSAIDSSPCS